MIRLRNKLRRDLPAIDIRQKIVKGFLGRNKSVPRSKKEQKAVKKALMQQFPDRYYVDELNEWNSINTNDLRWIDDIELFLAATED